MTPSELSNALWDNVERVVAYLLPNGKKTPTSGHVVRWMARRAAA